MMTEQPTHKLKLTYLRAVDENPWHGHIVWECSCGKGGSSTPSYLGQDLVDKAKKNWRMHVRRAEGKV